MKRSLCDTPRHISASSVLSPRQSFESCFTSLPPYRTLGPLIFWG
jgi:hypothetical protein